MEDASPPGEPYSFGQPCFDTDFKPTYALSECQHQMSINQMASRVIAIVEQFKLTKQGQQMARQAATPPNSILHEYDDDIVR
jgi:hypothetical protein